MNLLITGISGFLGRNMVNNILNNKIECNIIGTGHSEAKIALFKSIFPNIKIYVVDLSSDDFKNDLENILKNHKITHIIHSAAMKHVDICQENPTKALKVNTIATNTIINVAKQYDVKNIIALSTDKTNNPCNTYGMVKYIMQEDILANNFSVYQGANFFWSDGSVLDIWFNQFIKNKPLTIRDKNHVRYFNTIDDVCSIIFENINEHKKIILPKSVYSVKLEDLLDAFCEYFNYHNVIHVPKYNYEKEVEILRDEVTNIICLGKEEVKKIIDKFYKNML